MPDETLTFTTRREKREALDELARAEQRDVGTLLNEALDAYLDARAWQIQHIRHGLAQAENDEFATDEEVARAFGRSAG